MFFIGFEKQAMNKLVKIKKVIEARAHSYGQHLDDAFDKIPGAKDILNSGKDLSDKYTHDAVKKIIKRVKTLYPRSKV
jgi:hypothetical protein